MRTRTRSNKENTATCRTLRQARIKEVVDRMKERARTEMTPVAVIYRQETTGLNPLVAAATPSFHSLDSTLYRCRRARYPPLPQSRQDIHLPDVFRNAIGGQRFFLSSLGENDAVVFVTDGDFEKLCSSRHWFIDGIFKVTPHLFQQLVTVPIMVGSKCIPVALLSRKTRQAYVDPFRCLKDEALHRQLELDVRVIATDFESGLMPAIAAEFPDVQHKGCFFHFSKAVYKRVPALGLQQLYRTDEGVRNLVRSTMALAFLAVEQMVDDFDSLQKEQAAQFPQLNDLFAYFRDTWIEVYPLHRWNVANLGTRTNNHVEGWHNRFANIVSKYHPNLWYLLEAHAYSS